MFDVGLSELIVILIVALLLFGPSKLPEIAKSLGRAFNEFRRMAEDVKDTMREEMTRIEAELESAEKKEESPKEKEESQS